MVHLAADQGGHPIDRAPRSSRFGRLVLELMHRRWRCKARAVVEAVHVHHRARRSLQLRNRRDEDTAVAADQEIGGARTEAIEFDERPIVGRDLEQSCGIGDHARIVAAAE